MNPASPDPTSHPAVAALWEAIQKLADLYRQPVDQIHVTRCKVTARDAGGFRIKLNDHHFHTDAAGNLVRGKAPRPAATYPDTEIRLRYEVTGGITGRPRTFETDSTQLTAAEDAALRDLITRSNFFTLTTPNPTGTVYDGITQTLWIAIGRRNHTVVRGDGIDVEDSPAFRDLLAWAEERTPPAFPLA